MFGERLKLVLDNNEIKQVDLARHLNLSQQAINRWCQNITRPDFETLVKIADFLNVSTDFLLGKEEKDSKNEDILKEKQILKKALIESGYMKKNEDLSNEELKKLMEFVKINKKYIKDNNK